jgi:hypothetical protein
MPLEKLIKIMSKENFTLKNQSETLSSNIKVVKTNVSKNIDLLNNFLSCFPF